LESLDQIFFLLKPVAVNCGSDEFGVIDGPTLIDIGLLKEIHFRSDFPKRKAPQLYLVVPQRRSEREFK